MDDPKADDVIARSAMAKATWRILPLIGLGYLIAYMDRSNISFASVQMNADLGFSAAIYGLGAGMFFVGYSLFEIPSNLLSVRFGPRRWIARIMLTWGVISAAMMFVQTPTQFYVMRFLLGVAEAGFFPGVMLYISLWFPSGWRGRAISQFYIASPLGTIVMGVVAGGLLGLGGLFGLRGWQWLFLAEGLPAVVMAGVLLAMLPDTPEDAAWLSAPEKAWLARTLDADVAASGAVSHNILRAMLDPVVVMIGLAVGLTFAFNNAVGFSGPKLLMEATGWSVGQAGFMVAIAGVLSTVLMLLVGWHSDHRRERYLHLAALIALSAVSLAAMALSTGPVPTVAGYLAFTSISFSVGMVGFFVLGDAVHPASRAVSFAAMNTIAQVGSFLGPMLWGLAADRTGDFRLGLSVAPFTLAVAVALVLAMRRRAAATTRPVTPAPAGA